MKICAESWIQNPYTKTWILFVNDEITQEDAVVECQKLGASLAILDSQEEMTWFFEVRDNSTGEKVNLFLIFNINGADALAVS